MFPLLSNPRPLIRVKKLHPDVPLPKYQTKGAAGMDVCAWLPDIGSYYLPSGYRCLIPTGLSVAVPSGWEIQVRPRSGLAVKHGITILNTPGTIDCDYRGEIGIILINTLNIDYVIKHLDRIAQLVVAPVAQADLLEVEDLDVTTRGTGGFGSTGRTGGML